MNDELQKLHEMTLSIAGNIQKADVDELLELVEFREVVIHKLNLEEIVLSDREKQLIAEISIYDHLLVSKMTSIKEEASASLNKLNQANLQKKRYEQQYSANSYFVDIKE
ncbi:hypothetical protein ACFQZE_22005 [Paenibacillus sp. GCM10027627]|uniref:hypothetical protein n=1 Tax=unclassified Paenibacillus TaxID=185978 RepID=UPI0036298239